MQPVKYSNALAVDVGSKRIGLARVNAVARIPEPLGTFSNDEKFTDTLKELVRAHDIDTIVVGLPRNLKGQETPQTDAVRNFVDEVIAPNSSLPVIYQDETLSSVSAESLNSRGAIEKYGLDSLAAVEILKDFVRSQEA